MKTISILALALALAVIAPTYGVEPAAIAAPSESEVIAPLEPEIVPVEGDAYRLAQYLGMMAIMAILALIAFWVVNRKELLGSKRSDYPATDATGTAADKSPGSHTPTV